VQLPRTPAGNCRELYLLPLFMLPLRLYRMGVWFGTCAIHVCIAPVPYGCLIWYLRYSCYYCACTVWVFDLVPALFMLVLRLYRMGV